jgi:hypothetical protein
MAELPDAKKWFTGFFDVTRWIKDGGTLIRLILICIIIIAIVFGLAQIRGMITRKKPINVIDSVCGNATVKVTTGDQKIKNGLLNIW